MVADAVPGGNHFEAVLGWATTIGMMVGQASNQANRNGPGASAAPGRSGKSHEEHQVGQVFDEPQSTKSD